MLSEWQWLDQVRALVLRGDFSSAESALTAALAQMPRSFELRRILAGVYHQTHRTEKAEALLNKLLSEQPQDAGSAFALAQLLISQARPQAAARVMRACFDSAEALNDAELAIRTIEMLDAADCKADAAAIAEHALIATPTDPRLHAYAGMLQLQLGAFERSREHYLFALEHSPQACEWHVPHGLANAQRYADISHPDFALFRECLRRDGLSDKARSTLLFALGKAHDDVGDYAQAAMYFRQANILAAGLTRWSRKEWRRAVEARLASTPIGHRTQFTHDFVPIFIVGMPRSGTTLLAELLSRYPQVRNRGELPWIAKLAQRPDLTGDPSAEALARAATVYSVQARRDDAFDARWFIDKQPLNFRYVDLMLALFPGAKILYCTRDSRDTALSLWMQSFTEEVQGYAYDFNNIVTVMRDCERLKARWERAFADSVRSICYEKLVNDSQAVVEELATWIGLPQIDGPGRSAEPRSSISTASLWQARQPIYSHSVGRWKRYIPHLPALLQLQDRLSQPTR